MQCTNNPFSCYVTADEDRRLEIWKHVLETPDFFFKYDDTRFYFTPHARPRADNARKTWRSAYEPFHVHYNVAPSAAPLAGHGAAVAPEVAPGAVLSALSTSSFSSSSKRARTADPGKTCRSIYMLIVFSRDLPAE